MKTARAGVPAEEAAMHAAMAAAPDDDTVRLAYADWLDENGRPTSAARVKWWVAARERVRAAVADPDNAATFENMRVALRAVRPAWVRRLVVLYVMRRVLAGASAYVEAFGAAAVADMDEAEWQIYSRRDGGLGGLPADDPAAPPDKRVFLWARRAALRPAVSADVSKLCTAVMDFTLAAMVCGHGNSQPPPGRVVGSVAAAARAVAALPPAPK